MFNEILFYAEIICALVNIYHIATNPFTDFMFLTIFVTIVLIIQILTFKSFKPYRKEIKNTFHNIHNKLLRY